MFDLASISTHAVCPTAVHSARHRRPDSRRLAFRSRLVGQAVAFVYNSCTLTVNPLRSGLIRPFLATMRSSDSRHGSYSQAGPLRFLDFSFPMRCLQSPRGVRRLRAGVASPAMADFNVSGSMVTPKLCNEAESSSLALRLTGSPRRASAWGLLLSPPSWLRDGHPVITMITFQIIREVRLSLTHQRTRRTRRENQQSADNCTGRSYPLTAMS